MLCFPVLGVKTITNFIISSFAVVNALSILKLTLKKKTKDTKQEMFLTYF